MCLKAVLRFLCLFFKSNLQWNALLQRDGCECLWRHCWTLGEIPVGSLRFFVCLRSPFQEISSARPGPQKLIFLLNTSCYEWIAIPTAFWKCLLLLSFRTVSSKSCFYISETDAVRSAQAGLWPETWISEQATRPQPFWCHPPPPWPGSALDSLFHSQWVLRIKIFLVACSLTC